MRIQKIQTWKETIELTRPYAISSRAMSAVNLFFVRILTDSGHEGVGSGSPGEEVTGESPEATGAALGEMEGGFLIGEDPRHLGTLCRRLCQHLDATPAAHAALDMALHDLFCRIVDVPLVELLGRSHDSLPTSITIGIKSTEESLAEADEYLARGFRSLKVKIGRSLDEEIELLHRLRERIGPDIEIRVDANQGYDLNETGLLWQQQATLRLELIEQPLPEDSLTELRSLPEDLRQRVAADESLHDAADAAELAHPPAVCGILNIKLMKCGGVSPALAIGRVAEATGSKLMWGCMDESVISIAAALHAALACPQTRYLDLDGSLDLSRDPAEGGFLLEAGELRTLDKPGLGATLSGPTSVLCGELVDT
jgi:L-alanine-DL-glutamate epimerase-like enolase superfamily enzyme